ncbi:MAG: hypothetical protein IJ523_10725 [Succinivibrionaceae bacterium]|nr:hypothetical protein [Succinivibrionaceae bacterium]
MKRIALIAAAMILVAALSFAAGRTEGIRHAIEDSEIWTVECYDPADPYRNERPDGTDQTIYITLDGQDYEHGMWQG